MGSVLFITESWLAENVSLVPGGEAHLPAASRLTPAARDLLNARGIRIRYADELGRVFVDTGSAETDARQQVHPLTGSAQHETAACLLCHQPVGKKLDVLTHLNARTFIAKNDPRIAFRGCVDSAIAQAVLLQTEWHGAGIDKLLQRMLADLRAGLGNVLRAETLEEAMRPISMGDFDEAQLHAISHNPLKFLGHDHIVPALEHGPVVARLNVLRATIREAEAAGARAFISPSFAISHGDVLQGLNRLSSAAYVLMLLILVLENPISEAGNHASD